MTRTLQLVRPEAEQPAPCPLTQQAEWHQFHAQRHRAHLPADPEPEAPVTARYAWHRAWADYHEQQGQSPEN